jgi:sugar lactone lactonase YvrE
VNRRTAELLVDGLGFPECPRWHADRLWVSDLHTKQLLEIALDGEVTVFGSFPARPGATGFLPDGSFYLVSMEDRRVLHFGGPAPTEVADLSALAGSWLNDLVVDREGRAYVTDILGSATAPGGSDGSARGEVWSKIFLVGRGEEPRVVADHMNVANGIVITPDEGTVITAETYANRLTAFRIADDGSLTDRRLFADLGDEVPNGISLDAEGAVWVSSHRGSFLRVVDGGEVVDRIDAPGDAGSMAVACMFGGEERRQLFLCSANYGGRHRPDLYGENPAMGRVDVVTVDVPGAGRP